eukprot:6385119-Karenia_brevis.AAC.1
MVSSRKKKFIEYEWTAARVAVDAGVHVPDVSNNPWLERLEEQAAGKDDEPLPRCRPIRPTRNDDLPKGQG